MYFVCVICMVGVERNPLKELTSERRHLWEQIISPRVNMVKLTKCLLLVCSDCNQLLDTMIEFRRTMEIGAKNLLALYRHTNVTTASPLLPSLIGPQLDLLLPVANEEIVQSTESWSDCEAAESLAPKKKIVKRPPASPATCINHKAVHVSEHNVDYAVLIPINEKKCTKLLCEKDVVYSSEISETSKSGFNLERKSAPELERESAFELIRESALKLIRESNLNLEHKSSRESTLELIRETALRMERKSKLRLESKSERELARKSATELARESALNLQHKSSRELERESTLELIRETALKLERKSKLKLENKSEDELVRKSAPELARESKLNSEHESGAELDCDSARESGLKLERESAPKLAPESGHESGPDSESTLSGGSDYEDPEMFPNIFFAKSFNGISEGPGVLGKCLEQEGKAEDLQIHSHIVTNPPSEWPCTFESCQLQSLYVDEDEVQNPTDRPRDVSTYRSKGQGGVPGRPKCKLCGKSFGKIMDLWNHYEREHMDAAPKCDVCRKECRNETELKFHKMKHQFKNMGVYEELSGSHACAECGVSCRREYSLRAHLLSRKHSDKMLWRFQCDICKRKCQDKRRIADHIQREHLAQEAIKCPMCTVCFKSARSLRRHASMHILASMQHIQTDTQTQQPPKRARSVHTNGYEDDILAKGEATQIETLTNSKKPRKTHKVNSDTQTPKRARNTHKNAHEDADILANGDATLTNRKKPRKTYKVNSRHKKQVYTQAHTYNEQFDTHTDMNGQTRKRPRNGPLKNANRQENTQTDTFRQARNTSTTTYTHTDTKTNRQGTHSIQSTQTNGVRKKRKRKCVYATGKRARTRPPPAAAGAVADTTKTKTSLFDMLSSFIL